MKNVPSKVQLVTRSRRRGRAAVDAATRSRRGTDVAARPARDERRGRAGRDARDVRTRDHRVRWPEGTPTRPQPQSARRAPGSVALGGSAGAGQPTAGARPLDEHELPVPDLRALPAQICCRQLVLERMLAGVATRRHARSRPVGRRASSRRGRRRVVGVAPVRGDPAALAELLTRDLSELTSRVDVDGALRRAARVALAITADGTKLPVGLWEAPPRTRRSSRRCSPTWSAGAWTPAMGCWS